MPPASSLNGSPAQTRFMAANCSSEPPATRGYVGLAGDKVVGSPPNAESQTQPAAGDGVHAGRLLGEHRSTAKRGKQDGSHQPDSAGNRGAAPRTTIGS